VLLAFTDNGEPGVGLDTQVTYPTAENPTVCPVPLFEYRPELPLIDGNYVVRDVQPRPFSIASGGLCEVKLLWCCARRRRHEVE
jgi:hypothetical protein